MYAYFAPDGNIQVRSISDTKKMTKEMISRYEAFTHLDYEKAGYVLHKISVNITPIV